MTGSRVTTVNLPNRLLVQVDSILNASDDISRSKFIARAIHRELYLHGTGQRGIYKLPKRRSNFTRLYCECGRAFQSPRSISAHRRQCPTYQEILKTFRIYNPRRYFSEIPKLKPEVLQMTPIKSATVQAVTRCVKALQKYIGRTPDELPTPAFWNDLLLEGNSINLTNKILEDRLYQLDNWLTTRDEIPAIHRLTSDDLRFLLTGDR